MITTDAKGLGELERQFTALDEKVGMEVLRDAGREALKMAEEDVKQYADFDDASSVEHMRDSIKIRAFTRKGRGNTAVTPRVGPSKKHYMKALTQEFGTVKQVADPFIRPALDYNAQKVLRVLTVEIRNGIQNRQQPLPTIQERIIMTDKNNTPESSSECAMLPAGTVVKFGEAGAAVTALRPLINCEALGVTGQTGGFVSCTTLLGKSKQSVSDLPEGPEKPLGFIDDPENEDFTAFLNAAEQRKTIQFYIEPPNKRTASVILALSGWQMNEITAPASEVIQITVQGKQNNIKWGIAAPVPDAGA